MKHPAELIETINKILDTVESIPGSSKGKSIINFDAISAIKQILGRKSGWNNIDDTTVLKRNLKKNLVVI